MDTRHFSRLALASASIAVAVARQQAPAQQTLANRILRMSEDEQVAYTNSILDQGMQIDETDTLGMLILNRSSLVLPMMERKIEEVLKSASPLDCFTYKSVDPQKFVELAASNIAYAGDEEALKQASKLIAIDEKRFGRVVLQTMLSVRGTRNAFIIAYHGFEIGDPAVDKRLIAWFVLQFDNKTVFAQGPLRHGWAEAMVDKYGGAPTEAEWEADPIASRITPELAASLHDEIFQLGAEAAEKHAKK